MTDRLGIEYTVFEYRGNAKKRIMEWRSSPGNIPDGLKLLKDKFGNDFEQLHDAAIQNIKKIMRT